MDTRYRTKIYTVWSIGIRFLEPEPIDEHAACVDNSSFKTYDIRYHMKQISGYSQEQIVAMHPENQWTIPLRDPVFFFKTTGEMWLFCWRWQWYPQIFCCFVSHLHICRCIQAFCWSHHHTATWSFLFFYPHTFWIPAAHVIADMLKVFVKSWKPSPLDFRHPMATEIHRHYAQVTAIFLEVRSRRKMWVNHVWILCL